MFPALPKTIDFTVDYLRTGLPRDAYARARVNRMGRRYASVHVEAWQDNRARLFAQATGHFLMPQEPAMTATAVEAQRRPHRRGLAGARGRARDRALGELGASAASRWTCGPAERWPSPSRRSAHRRVLTVALPIVVSNATIPMLGAVDTAVVGQLGQAAPIGAVGLGAVILASIYWVFGFLRMGTTGLVAQARGAGEAAETGALLMRGLMIAAGGRAAFVARRRRSSGPPSGWRRPRRRSRRWRGPISASASGARRRRSRSMR